MMTSNYNNNHGGISQLRDRSSSSSLISMARIWNHTPSVLFDLEDLVGVISSKFDELNSSSAYISYPPFLQLPFAISFFLSMTEIVGLMWVWFDNHNPHHLPPFPSSFEWPRIAFRWTFVPVRYRQTYQADSIDRIVRYHRSIGWGCICHHWTTMTRLTSYCENHRESWRMLTGFG